MERLCESRGATVSVSADPLDALARATEVLELPAPEERGGVLREEAAALVDGLLVRVARGRGALEVGIGEGLAVIAEGDYALRLGFSGVGDYARERLGIAGRTAQELTRLARELRARPLLGAAVRAGVVSARKAAAVLPVARGADEAGWVERARVDTVRALEAAVRAERGAEDDDEAWERLVVPLAPKGRAKVDEALALAGRLVGAAAPRWKRLEVMCQEFLAEHPVEPAEEGEGGAAGWAGEGGCAADGDLADAADDDVRRGPVAEWLEVAKAALEAETARWAYLPEPGPVAAAELGEGLGAVEADAELRRLVATRERWDAVMGHLALLVRKLGLWRELGFASLGHYASERLGMSARALEQRAALEARLAGLPELREALRDGRVSYEKARLVAARADEDSVGELIVRAEASSCVALRRELEAEDDAQMCARGELAVTAPAEVVEVVVAAIRAAREAAGVFLSPGECLLRVAEHFLSTWKDAIPRRRTVAQRVIERDLGLCRAPGCSRAADDAHHVVLRSRGGSDDPKNLVALCKVHHLRGVHRGWVRVAGVAPAGLRWALGETGVAWC